MNATESIIDAFDRNDVVALEALLDTDPELVNAGDEKEITLLHRAARDGNMRMLVTLINRGADMEAMDTEHRATPLNWAAFYGQVDVVDLLLDAGANAEAANTHGLTPRQCAEQGKTGEWKEMAPDATADNYEAILDLFAEYCDECAAEDGF